MKTKFNLSEDWATVVIAFASIFVILAGLRPVLPKLSWENGSDLTGLLGAGSLWLVLGGLFLWIFFSYLLGRGLMGQPLEFSKSLKGMLFVFLITLLAQLITGNKAVSDLGLEVVLFSLLLGLFISNVLRVPTWAKPALQSEYYIKTGLVLLGCRIIFGDIIDAGKLGLIQSVVVVFTVWYSAYFICKKLGLDEELRMMVSSAVSICGVSAAIATSGAIEGDSKKLSYVISLVLVVAIPMMLFMPYIAMWLDLPVAVAGAWMGGTIDTTGAVVAAGTLLGEEAVTYATVVKFSQNVLLGLAAFAISIYWTYTNKESAVEKPGLKTIWKRFPKFVLGFVLASLLFSFVLTPTLASDTLKEVSASVKGIQTVWFGLAFTCIGLETRFADIFKMGNGRPALAFITAQLVNVLITLVVAYLVFS
ncbi:MAG: putative sulfate exporter family transporter [Solitalea sp.]